MRAARALALVLVIIVSASLLAGLSYLVPSLFHRGRIIIRAYAMGGDGDPTQLTNASFSVWAWAPTPNGTEFIPVFNGTGPQAVISLARLVGWAKDWIHAYGKAAIFSFEPSIIIWVSYPIALPNGSVELVTQPSFQPINLSLPLSGSGTIIDVMVSHPFRTLLNGTPLKANGEGAGVAVRGLGKVLPEQTTTTTVTTTLTGSWTTSSCPGYIQPCVILYYLVPHVIAWYPNNESMAPISLAVALGQPSNVSEGYRYPNPDVTIDITVASWYVKQFTINGLMIAGAAFDAATDDYEETGNLYQAVSKLSPQLGTTFKFTSEGEVTETSGTGAYILLQNQEGPDIAQFYIIGQVALVNWTEYIFNQAWPNDLEPTGNWYLGLQLTEVEVAENDGAEAPVLYYWWAYDPCINVSEWAYEQQVLMQSPSYFFGTGMNSTCPLPNTPAPVIWQDYATNMTYYTSVSSGTSFSTSYVDLSVNGGESLLGIGIDAGSAIASIIGTALMASQPEIGAVVLVIGALLGAFQYQSNSVAVSVNTITIKNPLPNYYVNVFYSDLTPVYVNASGYSFTLPKELILINLSSSPPLPPSFDPPTGGMSRSMSP
ncbi:MAG: hypothetical protein RXN87_05365 [Acidilobus sp.]